MQEGDRQIWGQVIKINGQRDDRHMEICDRNHELQTTGPPTQDKEPDWNSFVHRTCPYVLHRTSQRLSFPYAPKIILKGLMSN